MRRASLQDLRLFAQAPEKNTLQHCSAAAAVAQALRGPCGDARAQAGRAHPSRPPLVLAWIAEAVGDLATKRLRGQLSYKMALCRKLHHEVQDLCGNVRVYCRPRPLRASDARRDDGVVSVPSHQIINLRRDLSTGASGGAAERGLSSLIFEYDRVFQPDSSQSEVYSETEELVLGALDGCVVCVMADILICTPMV